MRKADESEARWERGARTERAGRPPGALERQRKTELVLRLLRARHWTRVIATAVRDRILHHAI